MRWYFIVKSELIDKTWNMIDKKIDKNKIECIVNVFIRAIGNEIKNNNNVKIDGLGTFSPYVRQTHTKKHNNGTIEIVPDIKCVSFKPSKKLKE